jgi:hypothetical protein
MKKAKHKISRECDRPLRLVQLPMHSGFGIILLILRATLLSDLNEVYVLFLT